MSLDNGRTRTGAKIKVRADSGNFGRIAAEAYFTADAQLMIDTLLESVKLEGKILEPAAGRGDLVSALRARGFDVEASDLHLYSTPLVDDIKSGVDIFSITTLAAFGAVVTNLPYGGLRGQKPLQDQMLEHLLPLAQRDGCVVATIIEWQWPCASSERVGRLDLIHRNPNFAGLVVPPDRLIWFGDGGGQSQHAWAVWSPEPRPEGVRPFVDFVTRYRLPNFETKKIRKQKIEEMINGI
jgi:hypothetical protein